MIPERPTRTEEQEAVCQFVAALTGCTPDEAEETLRAIHFDASHISLMKTRGRANTLRCPQCRCSY